MYVKWNRTKIYLTHYIHYTLPHTHTHSHTLTHSHTHTHTHTHIKVNSLEVSLLYTNYIYTPNAPVGQLKRLVCSDVAHGREQIGQGKFGIRKHAHRLSSVKHVDDIQTTIALQPLHIKVSTMQNLGEGE